MTYLEPYQRAADLHGGAFESLLWTSPQTQEARFDAFTRLWNFQGQSLLDAGCGRADFLQFLMRRGTRPADYTGIEAVSELAESAERTGRRHAVPATILRCDFVREPARLFVAADAIVFSGSLNTLDDRTFYQTLRLAWDATAAAVIFNFLDSPTLSSARYLHWRRPSAVLEFAQTLAGDHVQSLHDYLDGDFSVVISKE